MPPTTASTFQRAAPAATGRTPMLTVVLAPGGTASRRYARPIVEPGLVEPSYGLVRATVPTTSAEPAGISAVPLFVTRTWMVVVRPTRAVAGDATGSKRRPSGRFASHAVMPRK